MNTALTRARWELKAHFCKRCSDPTLTISIPRVLDPNEARQLAADLLESAESLERMVHNETR